MKPHKYQHLAIAINFDNKLPIMLAKKSYRNQRAAPTVLFMEQLHQRLARIRKAKGLTAKAVAAAIAEAESTYRGWESGRGRKLPPFEKLCQVLSISVTELVVGHQPELGEALDTLARIEDEVRKLRLELSSRI